MLDFSRRSMQPELMDTEQVSYAEFHECLRQLAVINVFTLAYRPTLIWLRSMLNTQTQKSFSLFDIGSGNGDMLRKIRRWAQKRGYQADLTGVDMNPWSRRSAKESTPKQMDINNETANILDLDPSRRADFIISSLFTHHLTDAELVRFIQWMDAHATRGWFINDLHRHWLPYRFIKIVFPLLHLNRLVQHDGPVSVARAFVRSDYQKVLADAGIASDRITIRWRFPFRYGVACSRP